MIYYRVYNRFRNKINYFRQGDTRLQFFNDHIKRFVNTQYYKDIEHFINSFEEDTTTYEEITDDEFNKYMLAIKLKM